jgi:hypothetical protein
MIEIATVVAAKITVSFKLNFFFGNKETTKATAKPEII